MNYFYIFSTPVLFLLTSCTNVKVHSTYAKNKDFTPYRTYAILASSAGDSASLYNDPDIKYTFENFLRDEMEYRGYVSDSILPDLEIHYATKIFYGKRKVLIPLNPSTGRVYPDNYYNNSTSKVYTFDQPYNSRGPAQFIESEIVEAKEVVVLQILDRKEGEVIWEGQGLEQVKEKKELLWEVPWTIKKMLRNYPVKYNKMKKI